MARRWSPLPLVALALAGAAAGAEVRRELFLASPGAGTAVLAATYYTRPEGRELLSLHQLMSRSDTVEVAYLRHSADHGRTWSAAIGVPTLEPRPDGKLRRALRGGVADPVTGRFVRFYLEALLPNDDPLEGMRRWQVFYAVSADGGRSWNVDEPVVHRGDGFSREHPLPGVHVGRNAFMVGDLASVPSCSRTARSLCR